MQDNRDPDDYEWELDLDEWESDVDGRVEEEESEEVQESAASYNNYEDLARKDEERGDKLREALADHAHSIINVTKYVIPVSILTLGWHYILPNWLSWLTERQMDGLERFLVSGAGVGIVSTIFVFVQRYIRRKG